MEPKVFALRMLLAMCQLCLMQLALLLICPVDPSLGLLFAFTAAALVQALGYRWNSGGVFMASGLLVAALCLGFSVLIVNGPNPTTNQITSLSSLASAHTFIGTAIWIVVILGQFTAEGVDRKDP